MGEEHGDPLIFTPSKIYFIHQTEAEPFFVIFYPDSFD
jgi:hypothetical protein